MGTQDKGMGKVIGAKRWGSEPQAAQSPASSGLPYLLALHPRTCLLQLLDGQPGGASCSEGLGLPPMAAWLGARLSASVLFLASSSALLMCIQVE